MKDLETRMMTATARILEPFEVWNQNLLDQVRQQADTIDRISRLRRYLSPQIAEAVLTSEDDDLFKSHRREITVVFIDLRGFTAFSSRTEPEEVMELLRSYHTEMGKLIFKFEGTLEHFAGDGIKVFFNDPVQCEDHTERAVRMALEMRSKVKELRAGWLKRGYELDLGVGLAAGCAALGNIGFEGRMDYGAVGNVTNLAARLCGVAKGGQVLTDQKTFSRVGDFVEAEVLEELCLKGFVRPVAPFNIVKLKQRAARKYTAGCPQVGLAFRVGTAINTEILNLARTNKNNQTEVIYEIQTVCVPDRYRVSLRLRSGGIRVCLQLWSNPR